ncbi:MAG: HIT domain-containing protein [Crocinitomicaceae bacterium]|nr:HIT domain-containing protein [Crocinitomicaceae bacterium]
MASVFSKIIAGEIPCHRIAEDERYLAFLDIQPLVPGHVLVIPKIEVDYIFNCEDELLAGLILFAKKVAKMMEGKFDCKRIGVSVIGLEVPHTHIHLIPINGVTDMDFSREKMNPSKNELERIAELIGC